MEWKEAAKEEDWRRYLEAQFLLLLLGDGQGDGDRVAKCDLNCRALWSLNLNLVVVVAARELLVVMRNLRQRKRAGRIHSGRSQNRPLHRVICKVEVRRRGVGGLVGWSDEAQTKVPERSTKSLCCLARHVCAFRVSTRVVHPIGGAQGITHAPKGSCNAVQRY